MKAQGKYFSLVGQRFPLGVQVNIETRKLQHWASWRSSVTNVYQFKLCQYRAFFWHRSYSATSYWHFPHPSQLAINFELFQTQLWSLSTLILMEASRNDDKSVEKCFGTSDFWQIPQRCIWPIIKTFARISILITPVKFSLRRLLRPQPLQ